MVTLNEQKRKVKLLELFNEQNPPRGYDAKGRLLDYEQVKDLTEAKKELERLQWLEAKRIVEEWLK